MPLNLDLEKTKNLSHIDLLARQLVEGFITGLHKSPYHGFSVEFAEHRLYNTGESTRHIDWKVFAKTDRLYTKRYEEETNLRCQILIDNSSSMHYPVESKGKLYFSILSAAALSYMLHKQRDAFGLTSFTDKVEFQSEVKSTSTHLNKLYVELQNLYKEENKNRSTNVSQVLHEIAEKIHRRSLVVIFSDMFEREEETDEIFRALQHLKHKKHEILLFHVTDWKTEYHFDFDDRPYEFIDLESGEKLKFQPSEVKENYNKYVSQYYQQLKLKCGQLKIDFIEADINKKYDQVLNAYLIKRAKMS
ncbi:MAG: DUF58 domain-containing protein [Candidatus Cyclobacteriaceae bacterium M2_1C_046]